MEIKQNSRSSIDNIYKWNLETMYETLEKWDLDYNYVLNNLGEILKYKDNIMKSPDNLLNLLKIYFNLSRVAENLYIYANMRSDEDTSNTTFQTLKGKIDNLSTKLDETCAFIIPELLKSDYDVVLKYIKDLPELETYKFFLEEEYRFKKYVLSEKEEKLLSRLSNALNSSDRIASLLRNSDMRFGIIKDENDIEVELTNSNYNKYISSKNRNVRRDAFNKMYNEFGNLKNTFAATLSGLVETNVAISSIRGFNSVRSMNLSSGNIDLSVYDNLISTVNKNLSVVHKYYELKKELLNLDELHLYDVYVNLVNYEETYTYEQAKQTVLDSLKVLGSEYTSNIKRAFDENWIDVYENKGKKSGAYSWGSYDSNPYILLNFQGRLNDVSTLAHELGHSMHSLYSKKNNPYHIYNYKIFVAEVASTVNELILYKDMLSKTEDKNKKMFILNELMELFRATIYRQTMFAEFEKEIYEQAESGEILTYDSLSNKYFELNQKYFGEHVVIDEKIKYEWERIPHFYSSFYVYQYATGLSAACYIVNNILSNKENAVENYLAFLKTGGSDYPINELKIAGVDMNDKEVIESAIKMFDDVINQFKKLYNE